MALFSPNQDVFLFYTDGGFSPSLRMTRPGSWAWTLSIVRPNAQGHLPVSPPFEVSASGLCPVGPVSSSIGTELWAVRMALRYALRVTRETPNLVQRVLVRTDCQTLLGFARDPDRCRRKKQTPERVLFLEIHEASQQRLDLPWDLEWANARGSCEDAEGIAFPDALTQLWLRPERMRLKGTGLAAILPSSKPIREAEKTAFWTYNRPSPPVQTTLWPDVEGARTVAEAMQSSRRRR